MEHFVTIVFICMHTVNCSAPSPPLNGHIQNVLSSTLTFGCNAGYEPQETIIAICVAPDVWTPLPHDLICSVASTTDASSSMYINILAVWHPHTYFASLNLC